MKELPIGIFYAYRMSRLGVPAHNTHDFIEK